MQTKHWRLFIYYVLVSCPPGFHHWGALIPPKKSQDTGHRPQTALPEETFCHCGVSQQQHFKEPQQPYGFFCVFMVCCLYCVPGLWILLAASVIVGPMDLHLVLCPIPSWSFSIKITFASRSRPGPQVLPPFTVFIEALYLNLFILWIQEINMLTHLILPPAIVYLISALEVGLVYFPFFACLSTPFRTTGAVLGILYSLSW